MAGDDWGDLADVKPARSGRRLFCCSLGCLLPIAFGAVLIGWSVWTIRSGRNLTSQWERLVTLAPAAKPPAGWHLFFGFQPGWLAFLVSEEAFLFVDDATLASGASTQGGLPKRAMILISTSKPISKLFELSSGGSEPYLVPDPAADDASASRPLLALELQGRSLPIAVLRPDADSGGWFSFGDGEGPPSPTVLVDLTPSRPGRSLVLMAQSGTREPMELTTIETFLSAFDLRSIP